MLLGIGSTNQQRARTILRVVMERARYLFRHLRSHILLAEDWFLADSSCFGTLKLFVHTATFID